MVAPIKVATLGNAFLDRILYVANLPVEPSKMRVKGQVETGGGIAATAAVACARLGAVTVCYSRIGADAAGDEIIRRLREAGVRTDQVRQFDGGRSPQGTIIVEASGERMGFGFMGEGWTDDATWLDFSCLNGTAAVLADYSWWQGAAAIFSAAANRGAISVLDADINDLEAVQRLLPLADHVVFSQRCLAQLSGHDDPRSGLSAVAKRANGHVSVTAGAGGFYWLEKGRVRHMPAFPVKALDTNGAGDVFHGAYTVAVGEGRSVEQAGRFASAAAALKCAKGSGWESIAGRSEVDLFLNGVL
ncbi:PfkB family carbohydrate kinase [Pelagibacterium sp. H642]|uniref:PfkB family carbohydrate kinase n=1 Tax=Pelagibacterium sp. H642 TaxID=1881069 RepID=UPI00281640C8|nr:PfkB family carbohydrate kinase [Pelagibacterium sp. H642]WMT91901.1 PfkB family carbohydrate kinase [Pelagibacterium sp. H642]